MSKHKDYVDKTGKPVKVGDILFYSEPIPYAESIHVVEENHGVLCGYTVVGSTQGEYFLADDKNKSFISLEHYTNGRDNALEDAVVIGNVLDNPEFLTVEYATKNFPLSQEGKPMFDAEKINAQMYSIQQQLDKSYNQAIEEALQQVEKYNTGEELTPVVTAIINSIKQLKK